MMDILFKIKHHKLIEIKRLKTKLPLKELKTRVLAHHRPIRSFAKILSGKNAMSVIAEIKSKSPSAGRLIKGSPLSVAKLYAKSKADAVSVLTDKKYFGGSIKLIKQIKQIVNRPVIRKDFIVDEYQVYESASAGADAVLLIAAILSKGRLKSLYALAKSLGLDSLVEIHDEKDLKKALAAGAEIIGINNRDLKIMKTDLNTTVKLIKSIPKNKIVISESGIESPEQVKFLRKIGVRAILVGTSILKSKNPIKLINNFKS